MDPNHKSMMVELLAGYTTMPVKEIRNGETVSPNTIYINPPNKNLALNGNRFKLLAPYLGAVPKPSVDLFYTQLSECFGKKLLESFYQAQAQTVLMA